MYNRVINRYSGSEPLIDDGKYLSIPVLDFWQWAYSDIVDNTSRGTFAEYLVKLALDNGGYKLNDFQRGWDPYDLEGPLIPAFNRNSQIQVKSTAFVQTWGMKHPDKASFSIAPAKVLDEGKVDYPQDAPRQRNCDMYVFAVYTAESLSCNVLDLSWWKFYVLPTSYIEKHKTLYLQKTISLKAVEAIDICRPLNFNELCNGIVEVCNSITPFKVHHFYDNRKDVENDV
ncbi:MAG: hypothetical protein LIO87_04235 [Eubacterium sp.]|nr:hypothetical protein [Eubacterium sp.]